jgi:hypothetical protein
MKNKYLIRFNTKNNGSPLVWRLFENDVEHLATSIRIETIVWTEKTINHEGEKWNIACEGHCHWDGTDAVIRDI